MFGKLYIPHQHQLKVTYRHMRRGLRRWWREIKRLTGRDVKQDWYCQFLDSDMDIKSLTNKINDYFVGLTDHFAPLRQLPRPYPSHTNTLFLRGKSSDLYQSLKISKALGPDNSLRKHPFLSPPRHWRGDVSWGGTSATRRQKFHTDDVKYIRNPVRSPDWSTE